MAPDVARASTDPDWPTAVAMMEHAAAKVALSLNRFANQAQEHLSGHLTATDLCTTESDYQRDRRALRRAVQRASALIRRGFTRWDAASLLCIVVSGALDAEAIDRSVVVAIQVDVTHWTLEQYESHVQFF